MLAGLILLLCAAAPARSDSGAKLLLVTLDGLSWTEVFQGASPTRLDDPAFTPRAEAQPLRDAFIAPAHRPAALMPFLHGLSGSGGVLFGDRAAGQIAAVANAQWFSYPGYNELLTGRPDPAIRSNEHGPNANMTVLEWLNGRAGFKGRVEVVGSWNVYRHILNAPRSGLPVNDGWDMAPSRTRVEATIARLQAGAPRIWPTVRQDVFTHAYALEALRSRRPRVLYVAYGETDDFAHDGRYDQTLWAARRADGFIAELWKTLQADPFYAGKTTLIVTTDHGRGTGPGAAWKHHSAITAGSDAVWFALIGPGVQSPKSPTGPLTLSQVAATIAQVLGEDWRAFDPQAAPPLPFFGAP